MKILKSAFALTLVLFMASSCKNDTKPSANEKSQMQEVLAIHDEVMPKMGTIGKLTSQMDAKIKETDSVEIFVRANEDLKTAHKGMMDWMKNFGNAFDSDEIMKGKTLTEEKQKLLDAEETKIKTVRDQINTSIQNAEKLLK